MARAAAPEYSFQTLSISPTHPHPSCRQSWRPRAIHCVGAHASASSIAHHVLTRPCYPQELELPDLLEALDARTSSALPEGVRRELEEISSIGGLVHIKEILAEVRGLGWLQGGMLRPKRLVGALMRYTPSQPIISALNPLFDHPLVHGPFRYLSPSATLTLPPPPSPPSGRPVA